MANDAQHDAAKAKSDEEAKAKADAAKAKVAAKPTHVRVRVRARAQSSFRRAGFTFGHKPIDIPLAQLDERRLDALRSEPALIAELVTIPA